MTTLAVLIVLALAVVTLVLPVIALTIAGAARRRSESTAERLAVLEREVAELRKRPGAAAAVPQPPPMADPVPAPAPQPAVVAVPPPVPPMAALQPPVPPPVATPPPLPVVARDDISPATPPPLPRPTAAAAPAPVPPPTPPPPPVPAAATPAFNLEQFMGVKLFAWLGGGAFFLTAIFFLKYSFDHGWIPESVRAAIGFVAGAALLVGGLWSIRRGYAATGQSLCATGVVVLYAVTFACRAYYRFPFFTALPTFLLMTLITATAFLLAVRLRAQVVAVLGLVGGFLTPALVNTGHDNPAGLFGYVALLNLGLIAVALHRRWAHLTVLAAVGTVATQAGWYGAFGGLHNLPTAVAVCVAFSALFAAAVGLARRLGAASGWLAAAAILLPATALLFSLHFATTPLLAAHPGWILGNVLFADLALLAVAALHPGLARLQLFAGLAAFTVAAIWIAAAATVALLPWAFAFVVLAAGLNCLFPFALARLQPAGSASGAGAFFPSIGLTVLLIALARFADVGWWIWPVVLLLNLLALAAAAAARRMAAVAIAALLTLAVLALAIANLPVQSRAGGLELALVAGFAVFFCGSSIWLLHRLASSPGGEDTGIAADPPWLVQLPGISAALPFLLLVMLVFKLHLPDPTEVFSVALLLLVLMLGIATAARNGALVIAAFAGALMLEHAWFLAWFPRADPAGAPVLERAWFGQGDPAAALAWFVGFSAIFFAYPFAFRRRLLATQAPWAVAALALPLHFHLLRRGVDACWPANGIPGVLALACALPPLAGLVVLVRTVPTDAPYRLNRLAWLGAATLFFVTLVFPLQFSLQWITLGWALEGAALLWLFQRLPHPGLRIAGVALLCAAFVRLALNPAVLAYGALGGQPVFNWILYTYGIAALCCFAGARFLAPPRNAVLGINIPPVLATLGTVLLFLLVNLEIADAFTPPGSRPHLALAGHFPRDMSFPISWALFGLTLVVVGARKASQIAQYAGVALLAAASVRIVASPPVLEFGARAHPGVLGWLLATYGLVAAACFAGSRLATDGGGRPAPVAVRALLATLGTVLLFVLLNLAIADHFAPAGGRLHLEFAGNFARAMTYTIAWAVFAVGLLVAGIWRRLAAPRYAAIVLLGITFLKLIFLDLWQLDTIYKIGAFFGVSVVAIATSFIYQRYFRTSGPPQP